MESLLSFVGKIGDLMTGMIKIPKSVELEIESEHISWVASLLTAEGELPVYVVKFITVIAAS